MAKYKNIQSVIHNWAHSFLSFQNFDEQGKYFFQTLFDAAKSSGSNKIVINILSGDVSPSRVATKEVLKFTKHCAWSFAKFLVKQNVDANMISSARLEVRYYFSAQPDAASGSEFSNSFPKNCVVDYSTKVIAIDDRGVEHLSLLK